ncbi:beta-amylase 7 [Tanacetum coccineum]
MSATGEKCYDQYMLKSLTKAAEARGHSFWARGPENRGSYNSRPHETAMVTGFLLWPSLLLREFALLERQLPGLHWWYKTAGHAAELNAGFYNLSNRDWYAAIMQMLKKHGVALNFKSAQMCISDPHMDSS